MSFTGTDSTIITTAIALWFAQSWYLNEKLKAVHEKFEIVFQQFNGLREYLYEIDPQFDDERDLDAEFERSGVASFAAMHAIELAQRKRGTGRRTLHTPFHTPE